MLSSVFNLSAHLTANALSLIYKDRSWGETYLFGRVQVLCTLICCFHYIIL